MQEYRFWKVFTGGCKIRIQAKAQRHKHQNRYKKIVQREAKRKKYHAKVGKYMKFKILNLPNLCRNIEFEKFSPTGISSENEQKHTDTNINTNTKNRATRSETKKIPCESRKIHEIQNLCKDVDFEKFLPIGLRSEWKTPLSLCAKHALMINNNITWWKTLVSLHKCGLTLTHDTRLVENTIITLRKCIHLVEATVITS